MPKLSHPSLGRRLRFFFSEIKTVAQIPVLNLVLRNDLPKSVNLRSLVNIPKMSGPLSSFKWTQYPFQTRIVRILLSLHPCGSVRHAIPCTHALHRYTDCYWHSYYLDFPWAFFFTRLITMELGQSTNSWCLVSFSIFRFVLVFCL